MTQTSAIAVSAAASTSNVFVRWNGADIVVTLPDGSYADVEQLNASFQAGLDANKLYLENTDTLDRRYFMHFVPSASEALRLVVENPPHGATPPAGYQFPADAGLAWPYAAAESWPALQVVEGEKERATNPFSDCDPDRMVLVDWALFVTGLM